MTVRACPACNVLFEPDKFHPNQRYCTAEDCRLSRRQRYKQDYNKQWRQDNPEYFKQYWSAYRQL